MAAARAGAPVEEEDASELKLRGVRIYSSPFRRTQETAETVITALNMPVGLQFFEGLRERYFGPPLELQSHLHYPEIWAIDAIDPLVGPEGGESVADVAIRVSEAIAQMEETMIPLFDFIIHSFFESRHFSLRPVFRMVTGMILSFLSFLFAGLLQQAIDSQGASNQPLSMLWQIPQYVVMTAGEIMFSITGLEFAYSQAGSSLYLQAANETQALEEAETKLEKRCEELM